MFNTNSKTVSCNFCAHHCQIKPNSYGLCGIRKNIGSEIITDNYAEVVAMAVDPIEKKPLYHFMPGAEAFSIALSGCNFSCNFCQNYHISQKQYFSNLRTTKQSPEQILNEVNKSDIPIVAYTYSEPTVWRDYMIDCAKLTEKSGRKNIMVTNGFFSVETLDETLKHIDAFNIDLKGSDSFYRQFCGGRLEPVLNAIRKISLSTKHLEVTTLLIESLHTVDELMKLAEALEKAEVKVWHLSRFFPCFKMLDQSATSEEFLQSVIERVKSEFDIPHIYAGNSGLEQFNQTICSNCGEKLINRQGYSVTAQNTKSGKCPACSHKLYGYFPDN